MRVLDLFSGGGGMSLGLQWAGGYETVGFCEIDPFCREVLANDWPGVWIHDDVRTLSGGLIRERCGAVDLICGGFPCQPFSCAGKQKGEADERFLWPELARVIGEVRPRWLLLENVPNLRTIAADRVLAQLEGFGYSCWPLVVGADDVGAPHRRKRVWIVANASSGVGGGGEQEPWREAQGRVATYGASPDVGNAESVIGGAGLCEVGAIKDWRESANTSGACELAYTAGVQPRGQQPARDNGAGHGGAVVANADSCRRDTHAIGFVGSRKQAQSAIAPYRWPARPGEEQYEWEEPRCVERGLGGATDGIPAGVVERIRRISGWSDARAAKWYARNQVRIEGRRRRERLKSLGNSVVPQVVCAIGLAIRAVEEDLK